MDPQLLQRIKSCKTLPAIPSLPLQVLRMCREEHADASTMAAVISKDPSFVAKLLNVANSSFYGGTRHKVATVTQAVALLGMNSIATLAFCFSLYRDLRKKGDGAFDHAQYWQRSILSSVAAKILARRMQLPNAEEVFLASLLQDLGVLVLSEVFAKDYARIYTDAAGNHQCLQQLEQTEFGSDHSDVGAWLAETWELPDVMQAAVRGSHGLELVADRSDEVRLMVCCVHLSGRIADLWCDAVNNDVLQAVQQVSHESLGLDEESLVAVFKEIAESIPEFSAFFQVDLGSEESVQRVIVEAEQTFLNPVT